MPSERVATISTSDGGVYDSPLFLPDAGRGPGIVLLQEVFGVGSFIRAKAIALAELGYVVLCPDVYWRVEPGVAYEHDDAGLADAFAMLGRWSTEVDELTRIADLLSAFEHLRGLPEIGGRGVGVLGYCLGGRLAYELAIAGQPDAAVCYYGSGIGERLDLAAEITCPVLFHYGTDDPYIANDEVAAVRAAFADRDDVVVLHHEGAGHAFENHDAGAFHQPEAAAASWPATVDFLRRHLPG